ncbi:SDR family NAD(P)-dependent oxidoreductase [Brachybacterium halotolerans subsp. kimchii]|uniref:SDR family NAD(P)-dependent oxidoreductase n=1 Tax=Brachybacterium halotolerans TaxID=2795215 RepID=A0ABS1BB62_9MICO|nr:SDR family NAD(P)-dependent oxidoreductase [Brachybacterium halotolerans]MBK0331875.1 SDR family NAD(P)-dependent oxidoreductase [Brachybacterium halotolerans]UEJ82064.1 SDR family NAD(P)-dependent oxidoreductase [Brachybacterium halotolerans subsp. kimchii]
MHRALITGGTAGIGAAFARAFARRGVALVLVARDDARLQQAAAELRTSHGVEVETLVADLADRDDQQKVADRLESTDAPAIDVLVNNAGFSVRASLLDPDLSEHDRGFEVMQRAVLKLGGAAGRAMSARGEGWIINIASVSAFITQNNYTAIKAWVTNYSESLSVQLEGTGVQSTAVTPGWVRTEFHQRAGIRGSSIPGFLWLDADDLAEQGLKDVAKGKAVSIPGGRWKLITALLRSLPRPLVHRLSSLLSSRRSKER